MSRIQQGIFLHVVPVRILVPCPKLTDGNFNFSSNPSPPKEAQDGTCVNKRKQTILPILYFTGAVFRRCSRKKLF